MGQHRQGHLEARTDIALRSATWVSFAAPRVQEPDMKRWLLTFLAVAGLLGLAVAVWAGPFRPLRPAPTPAWRVGPQDVQLTVESNPNIRQPRLYVPRALLVTTTGSAALRDREGSGLRTV